MDLQKYRALVWSIIVFAIAEGNQLSGQTIPWLSQCLYALAVVLIVIQFVPYLWPKTWPTLKLQFPFVAHSNKSVAIREVMYWVDEKSAWGRWQKAINVLLQPGGNEQMQKWLWTAEIQRQAEDGKLSIDGRRKGSLEREAIKRDFWDIAYLDVRPHPMSLWRVSVAPKDGLPKEEDDKIRELGYEDLRTNWSDVKSIWPERDRLADKLTKQANKKKKIS